MDQGTVCAHHWDRAIKITELSTLCEQYTVDWLENRGCISCFTASEEGLCHVPDIVPQSW